MLTVLTVCSGNLCRSPLAAQLLRARLGDLEGRVAVSSLGTLARDGQPMDPRAAAWSRYLGGDPEPHRTTFLTAPRLRPADLVLAMAREHRRAVVSEVPALTRQTFTMRELARLAACSSDEELRAGIGPGTATDKARLQAVLRVVAATRSSSGPPRGPADDDVVDPMGRGPAVFELAARQVDDAVGQVERVLRVAAAS